jgi:hypothetical protein
VTRRQKSEARPGSAGDQRRQGRPALQQCPATQRHAASIRAIRPASLRPLEAKRDPDQQPTPRLHAHARRPRVALVLELQRAGDLDGTSWAEATGNRVMREQKVGQDNGLERADRTILLLPGEQTLIARTRAHSPRISRIPRSPIHAGGARSGHARLAERVVGTPGGIRTHDLLLRRQTPRIVIRAAARGVVRRREADGERRMWQQVVTGAAERGQTLRGTRRSRRRSRGR